MPTIKEVEEKLTRLLAKVRGNEFDAETDELFTQFLAYKALYQL